MLNELTISELTSKLARREVSAREATQACLQQIQRVEPDIRAFLSYDAEDALAQADAADKVLADGVRSAERPLLGVPIAIKDVIAVKAAADLRIEDSWKVRVALRRHCHSEIESCGRRGFWQAQHGRFAMGSRRKIPHFKSREIPGIRRAFRAVPPAERRRQLRRTNVLGRLVPTRGDRFGSLRPFAAALD